MPAVFQPWCETSSAKCSAIVTPLSSDESDNTDIFLNQLIQFYSNNARNLQHSTNFTQYAVLPHNIETTDYCDVTSPYVYNCCLSPLYGLDTKDGRFWAVCQTLWQTGFLGPAGELWPTGIVRPMLSTRCRHCCRSIVTTLHHRLSPLLSTLGIRYNTIRYDTINYIEYSHSVSKRTSRSVAWQW